MGCVHLGVSRRLVPTRLTEALQGETALPRQTNIHPDGERKHCATRDELKFG